MSETTIQKTRERILEATLRASVILGGLAWLPGVWASIRGGVPQVVVLSTSVYAALLIATFAPRIGFRTRSRILLGILYVLACGLLLAVGPPGAGALWLVSIPVLSGVLLGIRGAILNLVGAAVVCIGMGVLVAMDQAGPLPGSTLPGYTLESWIATAGSLLFLAAVSAIAVGVMVDRLEQVAASEREARLELQASTQEQLQLETRLRQAQKHEALGTLAGGIAHDFNNLLVPLIAGTEDARDGLPDDSPVRERLDDVVRSATRGRDLVRRILSFSRGSTGEPRPVAVDDLIDEVIRLLRPTLPASIRIESRITADGATVLADPTELHQVLMNLATNGYLAMEDGTGSLTFELDADRDEVRVRVTDTGVGMGPETLQRALDPFFTTRAPDTGTGLGLSTAHGIVRSLGGRLVLDSQPGRGTTAEVRLPQHDGVPDDSTLPHAEPGPGDRLAEPDPNGTSSEPGAPTRVLLVDDDAGVRTVTQRVLERAGYRVTSVPAAAAGLERLMGERSEFFDLLLTDQTMPEMAGLELLRRLRDEPLQLPALLMSGFLNDDMRSEAARLGARVLSKPFQRDELLDAVSSCLGGSRRADPDSGPGER